MREVLQVLLIGATGLAAYAVIFNWAALVVNARNQKRRGPGRVSPIFLVPQIIALITAMLRSAAGLRFPPLGVVLTVRRRILDRQERVPQLPASSKLSIGSTISAYLEHSLLGGRRIQKLTQRLQWAYWEQ
jgi:hypothetical protein